MKLITALLPPAAFESVRAALAVFGARGLTVSEVHGPHRRGPHRVQVYRGRRIDLDLDPLVRVDLLSPDDEVADLVHVLTTAAGDVDLTDRVWLSPVELVVRIRTREYGIDAL